jgi:hypothetical protein
MRRALIVLMLSMGLIAAEAGQADAASTRAEYIAQVDPICQTFVGPMGDAFAAYQRSFKALNRAAKSGNTKRFLRGTKRTAASLNRIAQTRTSLLDQITPVQTVAADAGTVNTWLGDLRQESGFEKAAATAVLGLKIGKFFHNLRQADAAQSAGGGAIAGFGFKVCGTPPVV